MRLDQTNKLGFPMCCAHSCGRLSKDTALRCRMSHLLVGEQRPDGVAHAALGNHVPRPARGPLKVAARAGRHLLAFRLPVDERQLAV